MIQGLLSDPSFIPVTIVFSLFVLFAYWQELNKYVIHLSIVYAAFLLFTAISYSDYDQVDEKDTFVNKDSSEEVLLSEDTIRGKDDDLNLESSSAFAIKEYIPKEEEKDNLPKTISVKRLIVCENINFKLRKPVRIRDVFLDTTSRIYCFAGIKNPDNSENITHYWEYNGEPYAKVHMNISVSEYFRCWSYVTPKEGYTGQWSVSVIDDQNNVLKKQEFSIEAYANNGN
tara:strand:+ start:546 stop:1232 length:687 start_codon:yes stop_codon:yes gene_type:complete